ncbi:glycosyltransferase [Luteolibacter sp. SL250]|uniref:glycosyltransferase n=1 Tax=Luteolibacter sp. SL250 TaxID=2995170 RepID=UPI002271709E|nr:glycosyltransferase [Luteolibacter sp. SL250]WAC20198.1 glycosyltransferase [Luteolibacter sp. SL250]
MKKALILGRSNGVGLDRDASLVADALTGTGMEAVVPPLRGVGAWLSPRCRGDVAIHLERVAPWWKWKARCHFLIPNQERFPRRLLGTLGMIDHVLCKSRHAAEVFSKHHSSVHYMGFTSEDRMLPHVERDYGRFFHLAGRSTLKNTELILELWRDHPEWPELTLVQHPDNAPSSVPRNVRLFDQYLPDEHLRELQNSHGVHLCPSLSEGWGHYIVEAMSCRAVAVVTDAPPMNELVAPGRGMTVRVDRSEPRHLGWNFHAAREALEGAIQYLVDAPPDEKRTMGDRARLWFEENSVAFRSRFAELVGRLA